MNVAEKLLLADALTYSIKQKQKERRLKIACIILSIALLVAIGGIIWIKIY